MKRTLSIILILVMISPVSAIANDNTEYFLNKLEIMQGDANGNFRGDDTLTREEFVKMTVKIIEPEFIPTKSVSPFSDVLYSSWSAGYIQRASELGYFSGFPDGSFRPYEKVLPEQICKIMLKLLGYETENTTSNWAQAQISAANSKGLLDNVEYTIGMPISRINSAKIIKNTLISQKNNSDKFYIEDMGYKFYEDVIIISDKNVKNGYVSTSAGTFKKGSITLQNIQKQGNIIANSDNEIILFLPSEQNEKEYIIKTILPDGIIVFNKNIDEMIKIDDDTTVYDGNIASLYVNISPTLKLGDKIKIFYDNMSNINYSAITRDAILGPVTNIGGSFKTKFNITQNCIVNRDGILSDVSAVKDYDICYYVQETDTVLAYSKKATGIYENAYPNKDNVQKIILSGKEYELGGVNAFNKLSTNGNIAYGETIKILFDKDAKIADVVKMTESESLIGFLINTGLKSRIDEKGEKNIEYSSSILLTDGTIEEYCTNKDYENIKGKAVTITFKEGKANLNNLSSKNNISGIFDWNKKTFGFFKISESINIIDVANDDKYTMGKGEKIYPQRIGNAQINPNNIIYIKKDGDIITDIILNDYTNDLYNYGIVLKDERLSGQYAMQGTYDINMDGNNMKVVTPNCLYPVYSGQPAKFDFDNNSPVSMVKLNKLEESISDIDELYVYTKKSKYLISPEVLVYQQVVNTANDGQRYEVIPISKIVHTKNITAYYDKLEKNGGRIRVILVNLELVSGIV